MWPLLSKYLSKPFYCSIIISTIVVILYANTLAHQFTQDDAIVIYDNVYTQKGFGGIIDIFTNDTFQGFFQDDSKSQLVLGGRYRPLSVAFFAVIWQFFGNPPWIYHLLAIAMFAFLSVTLYKTTLLYSQDYLGKYASHFSLIAAFIFAAHPIHTEVVANVKGLDESMTLLFALLGMWSAYYFVKRDKWSYLLISAFSFLCSLLSKENGLPFLLITPLSLFLFLKPQSFKGPMRILLAYTIVFAVYILIRVNVVGWPSSELPTELMNNPFIKVVNGQYLPFTPGEKWASIIWSMGKYFQLLIFPHPLTHDYYPRHLGLMSLTEPAVILSAIMNISLILILLLGIKKKSFISYLILFYYATIALTSNVLFPIGTHLSERFLFIPSVAFSLWVAYCAVMILKKYSQYQYLLIAALVGSITLMSAKTISRNSDWKDDYTLFTTDVKISKNSAKVRNAAAGAILARAAKLPDGAEKTELVASAITHLVKAVEVHPRYKNAHLLMGNAYFYQNKFDAAILAYRQALSLDTEYKEAKDNLFLALREGARYYGSTERNIKKAKEFLLQAEELRPNDYETISLLGIAHGNEGNHRKALEYFEKALKLQPNNARAHVNLAYAQLNMGLDEDAQISFQKALRIDPKAMDK